eukprot:10468-Heterococcus_DN1.PRE.1
MQAVRDRGRTDNVPGAKRAPAMAVRALHSSSPSLHSSASDAGSVCSSSRLQGRAALRCATAYTNSVNHTALAHPVLHYSALRCLITVAVVRKSFCAQYSFH